MSSLDGAFLELTRLGSASTERSNPQKATFQWEVGDWVSLQPHTIKAEQFSLPGGNAEGKVKFSGHVSLAFD